MSPPLGGRPAVFPLPLFPLPFRSSSRSARCRQHYRHATRLITATNNALRALNKLNSPACSVTSLESVSFPSLRQRLSSSSSSSSSLPLVQHRIRTHVFEQVRSFLAEIRRNAAAPGTVCQFDSTQLQDVLQSFLQSPFPPLLPSPPPLFPSPPSLVDAGPAHAATAATAADFLLPPAVASFSYFGDVPGSLVPLIAASVSLPDSSVQVDMLSVLPPQLAAYYATPAALLLPSPSATAPLSSSNSSLLSSSDAAAVSSPPSRLQSQIKPTIHGSTSEYIALVERMSPLSMLGFTLSPEAVNGVFTVEKDPATATEAATTRLIVNGRNGNARLIDPPTVALPNPGHLSSLLLPPGTVMWKSKTDLSNFYHHIVMPQWLQPFFCLPAIARSALPPSAITAAPWLADLPATTLVYPMCTRLPMGFSHAVAIAQAIHEHILYRANHLSPRDNLLSLVSPLLDRPVHNIYVDDNTIFSSELPGVTPVRHLAAHNSTLDAYAIAGFPVKRKKVVEPTLEPMEAIGILATSEGRLSIAPSKVQALVHATLRILRSRECTGRAVGKIVGSWTWVMMLRRFALSCFSQSYRFAHVADLRTFQVWPSVKRELAMVMALAPLLVTQLQDAYFPRVLATDASSMGAGMVATPWCPDLAAALWPSLLSVKALPPVPVSQPLADPAVSPAVPQPVQFAFPSRALPPFLDLQLSSLRWSVLASYPWSTPEHINALEMRVVLHALRWLVSHPTALCSRLLLLVDSQVVYYAVRKGRSGSKRLSPILRRIAALSLASSTRPILGWIPSGWNPADAPSRVFSP
jgi:hypothetical protein